jgi:hypothetical protein
LKRIVLRLGITFLGIALIAAIVIAVLNAVVLTPERVERRLSSLFGREVAIDGDVEFSLWSEARLTLRGVRLDNPPNSAFKHLLTLDLISVGLRWWDIPAGFLNSHPHFLDVEMQGGKVHVDSRQDVVGDDGVWPSADDPFTSMLGWLNSLNGSGLQLEVQVDQERIDRTRIRELIVFFHTGKDGAVIVDAESFDLTVNDFPVKGALRLDAPLVTPGNAPPAALAGNVDIGKIDFGDMLTKPSSEKSGGSFGKALPVHACLSWDVTLDLALGSVQIGESEITGIQFDVESSAGDWKLRLVNAEFPAGEGQAEISLRCGVLPGKLSVRSQVRSKGQSHFGQSGASVEVLGRMESLLDLTGAGRTWKEIVGDFAGRFVVFLGPVQTGALEDRFYSKGLYHALTVSWRQSGKAHVDCAVIEMQVENGVARSQQIVIGTPTLVIDGHGRVDLVEDQMEIVLIPRPKHARLGTVHVPVLISGPMEKPTVGLDWVDVFPRLGIETATALIEPLLANLPFDGLAEEERAACRRSLEPIDASAPHG